MTFIQINNHNGSVSFPVGFKVDSALTLDQFCSSPYIDAKRAHYGAKGYVHHNFNAGKFENADWHGSTCFFQQVILDISFGANLYPSGAWDWKNYSLDVQADQKRLNERVMASILGPPEISDCTKLHRHKKLPDNQLVLARPAYWKFDWGTVSSCHDFHGGGTVVRVSYKNRHKEAQIAYQTGAAYRP